MSTIRYQKRGNKFYVYEVTQYWDKELKKSRQTTKYLGHAETEGGEYKKTGKRVATPKLEKAILDFGDSFAINEIANNMGLSSIIKDSFGELSDSIMNLACYQIVEGSAMQTCEDWFEGNIANKLFPLAKIKSQDISRLIEKLGKQELQQKFFRNYVAKFFPQKTGLLIDSTALPSAINSSINAYGYTSGGIKENITCLMLVDKDSKLPIYFRAIGGDISDNSTLQTTIKEIKHLGLNTGSAILDAGYCSKENLKYMCKEDVDFVTRLPRSHKIFYELVEEIKLEESVSNAVQYGDRVVFISSKEKTIYGEKIFAHVILDPSKKSKDMNMALKNNLDEELEESKKTELNNKIKYSGFLILLSKSKIDKQDILPTYYTRQAIEQIFGFAKTNNNLLPLRVHSEQSVNGYLMLVFISLILFITARQKLQPDITTDKAMLRLRGLKAKIYDQKILIQEPNKKVKDVVKALGVIMPKSLGV
jgi:transposase